MIDFLKNEFSSWEKIKNSGVPVLIYGMGNGADKVIDELDRLGIPVLGVTAGDDFVRGQSFRGFKVKKLSDFSGDFIIAPAFGSSLPEVMNHIYSLSVKYRVIIPVVPVYGDEIFNRDFVEKYGNEINSAYSLFAGRSKEVYEHCVKFLFGGELSELKAAQDEKEEIFRSFLCLDGKGTYLDLGAYRGDTVEEYLDYTNGAYEEIIALEPDEKNCRKMNEKFAEFRNFTSVCKAVSDKSGFVRFSSLAGRQSSVSLSGKEKECISVDELCDGKNIGYIKADVEGSEAAMIKGAQMTLKRCRPKLNIALYHRSRDIFEIPLMIKEICPDYSFELRKHPYIPCWDMNLYCR